MVDTTLFFFLGIYVVYRNPTARSTLTLQPPWRPPPRLHPTEARTVPAAEIPQLPPPQPRPATHAPYLATCYWHARINSCDFSSSSPTSLPRPFAPSRSGGSTRRRSAGPRRRGAIAVGRRRGGGIRGAVLGGGERRGRKAG